MDDSKKKTKSLDGIIPPHWLSGFDEDSKSSSKSKLSPSQRVKIIEKAYKEILCREPDTRDLNYYKYSSANEESIRGELIEGEEHQNLIKNGREFNKVKNLLEDSKSKIRSLEKKLEDQEESLRQMESLLKEKNLHIEEIKKKIQSPFENT